MQSSMIDRRDFLRASVIAAGGLALAADAGKPATALIDTHVYVGGWPLSHLTPTAGTNAGLVEGARATEEWVSSLEGLFHKDIDGVNQRLATSCERSRGRLTAIGVVNPMVPDWEDDVRRCAEKYRMPGIRVHPTYHGYGLGDRCFGILVELATAHRMFVHVVPHRLGGVGRLLTSAVSSVDVSPLAPLARTVKDLRLLVSCSEPHLRDFQAANLGAEPNVWVDTSGVLQASGLNKLLNATPATQVAFGSASPLPGSGPAAEAVAGAIARHPDAAAIRVTNARRLIDR